VKNIKLIYCNGSSHSAGGGLEITSTLTDNKTFVRDYYKDTYNVWWDNQEVLTYSHRLANIIGCDVVNDSASGGLGWLEDAVGRGLRAVEWQSGRVKAEASQTVSVQLRKGTSSCRRTPMKP
jgi:hypothetical protein